MVNTSPTYWSVDGVSLQTLAMNIRTLTGMTPPPLRGTDQLIPNRRGERWVPKQAGSRTIPFEMWVRGTDEDGLPPASGAARDKFIQNAEALVALLFTPGRQINLTKRFLINGGVKTATAKAEYAGGLEPAMIGRNAARLSVDLRLADPYFYDDAFTQFSLVNGNNNVTLPGTAETTLLRLIFNGSRTNPLVKRTSGQLPHQVEYFGPIPSGARVELDVDAYDAVRYPATGSPVAASGLVRNAGAPHWLSLEKGLNVLALSSSAGTGTVQLQAKGAWI